MTATLIQALTDRDFCSYFVRTGGGFHPVDHHPLLTSEALIHRYCMAESEWLCFEHRYWPDEDKGEEIGGIMSDADVRAQLKIREIQKAKLWRFYVAYIHGFAPMHTEVDKLLSGEYKEHWVLPNLACSDSLSTCGVNKESGCEVGPRQLSFC